MKTPYSIKRTARKDLVNGFVDVIVLENSTPVEVTSTCLPLSSEGRLYNAGFETIDGVDGKISLWNQKWVLGISLQTGCPIGCKFCSVGNLTKKNGWRNLSLLELKAQFSYVVNATNFNPNDCKLFKVSPTRMGEPIYNQDVLIEFMRLILEIYPKTLFYISTSGVKNETEQFVKKLINFDLEYENEVIELQFSVHSTDDNQRYYYMNENLDDIDTLGKLSSMFYTSRDNRRPVVLNFALTTESIFNMDTIREKFDLSHVYPKVSVLGANEHAEEFNIEPLHKVKR